MSILVDTSVWIEYFRSGKDSDKLDFLIDENAIVINDLILAELIPPLRAQKQNSVIKLLCDIEKLELSIDWTQIIEYQVKCLKSGINGIGIPDLLIAHNARKNNCTIYTFDKHFKLIKDVLKLNVVE